MATQHPDNAAMPFWHSRPFISTSAELNECFRCFSDLGIDEYNWDWEGKFVDEAVVDRLVHRHYGYFRKHPLGKDKFLTFRLPNPRVEKQFRVARAFMVMITSSQLAKSLGFDQPPVFETILPLTETADEVIDIQIAFRDLVSIEHRLLHMEDSLPYIHIIPLFEQVQTMMHVGDLLRRYISLHTKSFGSSPVYLRPYLARSDPALNSGLIPTVLAVKVALSSFHDVAQQTGVAMYPMLGTGALPFRGGLTPETVDLITDEYAGVSTFTVQGGFRYDYPISLVKKAIGQLHENIQKTQPELLNTHEREMVTRVIPLFEQPYQASVEELAPLINALSAWVPKRRERMQHIGLFGYSRGVRNVSLPRAIPFTASLYSLGIPPELIGTGRGIRLAKQAGLWEDCAHWYHSVREDLIQAGCFLNKSVLAKLAARYKGAADIQEDIAQIEKLFDVELAPQTPDQVRHVALSEKVYDGISRSINITAYIEEGGKLRKSLG